MVSNQYTSVRAPQNTDPDYRLRSTKAGEQLWDQLDYRPDSVTLYSRQGAATSVFANQGVQGSVTQHGVGGYSGFSSYGDVGTLFMNGSDQQTNQAILLKALQNLKVDGINTQNTFYGLGKVAQVDVTGVDTKNDISLFAGADQLNLTGSKNETSVQAYGDIGAVAGTRGKDNKVDLNVQGNVKTWEDSNTRNTTTGSISGNLVGAQMLGSYSNANFKVGGNVDTVTVGVPKGLEGEGFGNKLAMDIAGRLGFASVTGKQNEVNLKADDNTGEGGAAFLGSKNTINYEANGNQSVFTGGDNNTVNIKTSTNPIAAATAEGVNNKDHIVLTGEGNKFNVNTGAGDDTVFVHSRNVEYSQEEEGATPEANGDIQKMEATIMLGEGQDKLVLEGTGWKVRRSDDDTYTYSKGGQTIISDADPSKVLQWGGNIEELVKIRQNKDKINWQDEGFTPLRTPPARRQTEPPRDT